MYTPHLHLITHAYNVFQATRPVQNYLKMPYDEVREQQQTARHLPLPLYVLYMQASAYQQACGKCPICWLFLFK